MTDIRFGRLVDLPLRDAWPHEAHQFTPWLALNIDHLSDVIGIPLELTGTEVAVEKFSADILARNPIDDSVVLIENQLETTDHTHLGQIMTYLAGLKAQTVIWIAPTFREPHLSAIRWLNQHTADGFSFFAVKARIVRIGDSPFAPIFEIVAKPNEFERSIQRKAESSKSAMSQWRCAFWETYLQKYPDSARLGIAASGVSSRTLEIIPGQLQLGRAIWAKGCSVYLRGPRGQNVPEISALLLPHQDAIESALGATFFDEGGWHAVLSQPSSDMSDSANWPQAIDFLHEQTLKYLGFLREIFPETAI